MNLCCLIMFKQGLMVRTAVALLCLMSPGTPAASARQRIRIAPNATCTPYAELPVPLEGQQQSNWCWAASAQMIMEYHGVTVPQCVQANDALGRSDCCGGSPPSVCNTTGWPSFGTYGFLYTTTIGPFTLDEIAEEIGCRERPIAFTWAWDGGGGHMMVAFGFDESGWVLIHDPLPVGYGSTSAITYSAYFDGPGYIHNIDYFMIFPLGD